MTENTTTIETVKVGGDIYEFKYDYEALREMDEGRGHNCFVSAAELAQGDSKPSLVLETLEVAMHRINGKEVTVADSRDEAKKFINRAGFQTAHTVTQTLLGFCLVGDVKKFALQSLEAITKELRQVQMINDSRLMTFSNRLFLWVCRLTISGMGVWLIFSDFGLLSLLNTD